MAWVRRAVFGVLIALTLCGCTCGLAGCSKTEVVEAQAQSHWLRFRITEEPNDGAWVNTTVIVDTETGCQYIFAKQAELGGLELLVDKYGNPLLADGYSRREVGMSDDDGE